MDTTALKAQAAAETTSGNITEAIETYKRILKADRNDLNACVKLAELYLKSGQRQHAVRFYEVAAKRFAATGVLPKAIAISKIILKLDPARKEIEALLTKLYAKKEAVIAGAPLAAPPPPPPPPEPELLLEEELVLEDAASEDEILLLEELEDDEIVEGLVDGPEMDALMAQLPKVPIFSDLAPQEFSWFVHGMEVKLYEPGEEIIVEGDPGDSFYIITAGEARVVKGAAAGEKIELAVLGEGAFFGEFAYLAGTRRTASVIASSPIELLQIKRENLDGLIADFPSVKTVMQQFFRDRMLQMVMAVSPLLSRLNGAERAAITQRMRLVEVPAGKPIIREDEDGKGFFIVAFGEVSVTVKNEFGGEDEVATLQAGEFFGEMSLLGNTKTSANVSTTQQSALLVLAKEDFASLVQKSPALAGILKKYAEERAQKNAEIRDSLSLLGEQGLV